jgi:WD40 repeat protein
MLIVTALAACSASGSRPASGPADPSGPGSSPGPGISSGALHSGAPRLAAAFTVPGGGLVNEAQFSADGKLAAAASASAAGTSKIYLWNVATRRYLTTLDAPGGAVYLAFGADDTTLTALVERAGSGDAAIDRWNLATGQRTTLWSPPGDANWIVSYDESTLAIANSADDAIRVLSVNSARVIADIAMPDAANIVDYGLELNGDGRTLIASDQHGNSYVWNISTGALIARLRYPASDVAKGVLTHPLYLSPDGKTIVVPDAEGPPRLVDAGTGADVTPRGALWNRDGGACLFSVDSKVCATPRGDHTIDLWDIGARAHLVAVTSPALVGTEGIPAIGPNASEVLALAPFTKRGTSKLYLWAIS